MPLRKGGKNSDISFNIHELIRSGYPQKQSEAIAESEARKTSKKKRREDEKKGYGK